METTTRWYHLLAYFFGGAFLANTVPHLVNGISGSPFQSPFAAPPDRACHPQQSMYHAGDRDARTLGSGIWAYPEYSCFGGPYDRDSGPMGISCPVTTRPSPSCKTC